MPVKDFRLPEEGNYYMNPKGQVARAECAVMLTKFMQKY